MKAGTAGRRYDRPLPMLHRILLCLLALALLNASPGLHWHEHSHEASRATQEAIAHAAGEEQDEDEDAHGICAQCLLQAQQTAASPPGPGCPLPAAEADHQLPVPACQPVAQARFTGATRVRGPPAPVA
ncbi:MAG TPA: hypothetical protein VFH35_01540 [Ramlibacter sp.]|nr:hypothetical protein [Ramlibacter sp.]